MICISVTPESRRLAKVDLLNASRHCDLIEFCLDYLIKDPDIDDLLDGVSKPVLVSCRRPQDGGHWKGSEEERMQLLRQAIVAGPAYVELDLDIARRVPRFGQTKRVISYTRLDKPLGKIDAIFEEAYKANADVVKFTWPTPTLDAAWPLLAAVSQKRELPVVGIGLGRAGLTFSLLGRKYGSPWIYAALEKGMEAHEGQATVFELDEVYDWRQIDRKTRFVGVVGLSPAEVITVRALNAAFKALDLNTRCLPLALGKLDNLAKMLDILKVNSLIVSLRLGGEIVSFAEHTEEAVEQSAFTDLMLKQPDGWHAHNTIWRSALKVLEEAVGRQTAADRPLDRCNVLLIGAGGLAQALAHGIHRRKGILSVAAPDDKQARQVAERFDVRHVPFAALYDTLADVVLITDPSLVMGHKRGEMNPSYLRPSMTVADISRLPEETGLLAEARLRSCKVVEPADIYVDQISAQFKAITGKELPPDIFRDEFFGAE